MKTILRGMLILLSLVVIWPSKAEASFVAFYRCMQSAGAEPDGLLRFLKGLDCELALSKEVKDAIPLKFGYMPTLDPRNTLQVAFHSNTAANLLLLNPSSSYVFGAGTDFDTLLAANSFKGTATIDSFVVTALPVGVFASFAGAADTAEAGGDLTVAFNNALWDSGVVLHDLTHPGLQSSLVPAGLYMLRVQVFDRSNGGSIYGLGGLQVIPEPSIISLFGLGITGMLGGSAMTRRRNKRNRMAPKESLVSG